MNEKTTTAETEDDRLELKRLLREREAEGNARSRGPVAQSDILELVKQRKKERAPHA